MVARCPVGPRYAKSPRVSTEEISSPRQDQGLGPSWREESLGQQEKIGTSSGWINAISRVRMEIQYVIIVCIGIVRFLPVRLYYLLVGTQRPAYAGTTTFP